MAWFERLHVGAHIPSGVVGGPLNSRPLPMKHLVICILSLAGSNPPQLIHAIRSRVRHLAPRCVARLAVAQWQKGESPTCKCGDWCFLSWRLQCGSYQDLLIPTLGLRSPFLVLNFLIRRTSADDDENDYDGDNLKREQWKSGCLRLLIHRVSLGLLVLILSPLKTFPSVLSSFDKNNFKKPQVGPSSMNPWSLSSLFFLLFLLWFHLFPIVVPVPVEDSGMQI